MEYEQVHREDPLRLGMLALLMPGTTWADDSQILDAARKLMTERTEALRARGQMSDLRAGLIAALETGWENPSDQVLLDEVGALMRTLADHDRDADARADRQMREIGAALGLTWIAQPSTAQLVEAARQQVEYGRAAKAYGTTRTEELARLRDGLRDALGGGTWTDADLIEAMRDVDASADRLRATLTRELLGEHHAPLDDALLTAEVRHLRERADAAEQGWRDHRALRTRLCEVLAPVASESLHTQLGDQVLIDEVAALVQAHRDTERDVEVLRELARRWDDAVHEALGTLEELAPEEAAEQIRALRNGADRYAALRARLIDALGAGTLADPDIVARVEGLVGAERLREAIALAHDWTEVPVCPYCGTEDYDWVESEIADRDEGEATCGECGLEYVALAHRSVCFETRRLEDALRETLESERKAREVFARGEMTARLLPLVDQRIGRLEARLARHNAAMAARRGGA